MAEMGNYCKGKQVKDFKQYPHWSLKAENLHKVKKEVDGKEVEVEREINDESVLYLQENYVVTGDIFKDEQIVFDNVTDEWKEFCHGTLGFEIPVNDPIDLPVASGAAAEGHEGNG